MGRELRAIVRCRTSLTAPRCPGTQRKFTYLYQRGIFGFEWEGIWRHGWLADRRR